MTNWPTLADYQNAINTPSCFLDPDLQKAKVSSSLIQGSNALVYQMQNNNKTWAVRLFLKETIDLENRYLTLSKYLKSIWIPNLVSFNYLAQGIQINGQTFPIVKMDWAQGTKLNDYITKNLNNSKVLMILAAQWRGLVNTLRGNRLSHGDLEPNNIIINEQEQILLVDYDSIFNPSLRGQNSLELGNSHFQHPQRNLESFDEKLADFSALVIYLSLRALAVDQNLWQKYHKSDNLIFSSTDFQNPRGSQLFTELKSSFDPSVAALAKQLEIACLMPFDATSDFESIVNQSLSTTSTDIEIPTTRVTDGLKKPTTSPMDENIKNLVANQISASAINNLDHQATSTNQVRSTNPIEDKEIPLTRVDMSGELSPIKVGKRGSDLNFNAQISLEDAARGITLPIKIPRLQFCQNCQGKMIMDGSSKCRTCKGLGKINIENTFNINIQPGVKDGERLCLTGQGEVSFDGGANGDLYVNIVIRQHHFFQRQGNDLYCTVNITDEQLGGEIAFLTIDGKNIMVKVPTNTANGTLIPIAGKGMPIIGESKNGDLYLTANLISNKVNSSQPPDYSSNTNQPFNNPYAPYVNPQQAQQNQRPLYYPDPLNDPSNSPNRTPFDNSYNPAQNMQKMPPYQHPYQIINRMPMGSEAFLDSILQQIKTNAMIAFALSVLSLFCFGAIAGPISFILGGKALKLINQHNIGYDYRVWALAGRYIGIFSFMLNVLIFLAVVFS